MNPFDQDSLERDVGPFSAFRKGTISVSVSYWQREQRAGMLSYTSRWPSPAPCALTAPTSVAEGQTHWVRYCFLDCPLLTFVLVLTGHMLGCIIYLTPDTAMSDALSASMHRAPSTFQATAQAISNMPAVMYPTSAHIPDSPAEPPAESPSTIYISVSSGFLD